MSRIHHRHRARILKRDRHRCFICKEKLRLDIHHIIPQRLGGKSNDENCVSLCETCHNIFRKDIVGIISRILKPVAEKTFVAYWKWYDERSAESPAWTVPPKTSSRSKERFPPE